MLGSQFYITLSLVVGLTVSTANVDVTTTNGDDLGFKIMGSIIQTTKDNNVALVKDENSKVHAVKAGHNIMDRFEVIEITKKSIQIKEVKSQKLYVVFQDKFANDFNGSAKTPQAPVLSLGGNDFFREDGFERKSQEIRMTAMYRDRMIKEDLAKILMQATAEPVIENGAIVGFQLSQIDEGSIYEKAGLIENDVVTMINEQKLNNVASAVTLLQGLKNESNISISIKRGTQNLNFTLTVQ